MIKTQCKINGENYELQYSEDEDLITTGTLFTNPPVTFRFGTQTNPTDISRDNDSWFSTDNGATKIEIMGAITKANSDSKNFME